MVVYGGMKIVQYIAKDGKQDPGILNDLKMSSVNISTIPSIIRYINYWVSFPHHAVIIESTSLSPTTNYDILSDEVYSVRAAQQRLGEPNRVPIIAITQINEQLRSYPSDTPIYFIPDTERELVVPTLLEALGYNKVEVLDNLQAHNQVSRF